MISSPASILGAVAMAVGVMLLGVNVVGAILPVAAPPAATGDAAPGFLDRRIDPDAANRAVDELLAIAEPGLAEARRLHDVVSDYLVHDEYFVQPWDNWWLWTIGLFEAGRRETLDDDLLWRRGSGICHQAAIVYAERSRSLGFEPRLVWLNGHVVAQIDIPGAGRRAVDPDMGVFWDDDVDGIVTRLGHEGIARVLVERGHPEGFARSIAEAYATTEDNVVSYVPHLPKRARAERRARVPKWAVPVLLVVLGAAVRFGARRSG